MTTLNLKFFRTIRRLVLSAGIGLASFLVYIPVAQADLVTTADYINPSSSWFSPGIVMLLFAGGLFVIGSVAFSIIAIILFVRWRRKSK